MDFMDNVKRVAAETAQAAVKKSGELMETAKIKYAIFDLKNEIRKTYEEIGSDIYRQYSEDADAAESVRQKCLRIDALNHEIAQLSRKLGDLKNVVECAQCGKSCKIEMEYCPYCGSRLERSNVVEAEIFD